MGIKYSRAQWKDMQRIFDDVLNKPDNIRAEYLKEACSNDTTLYRDIKILLDAEKDAPSYLDRPAVELIDSREMGNDISDYSGMRIGPYRLCEEIGRGGMGVIYRAERAEGSFQQQVAIKLLWNWKSKQVLLNRFRREQQLLASLRHRNIAQLFDGGITEKGQPYLVMEYIQGEIITRYCDEQRLDIDSRMRLLLQVMKALKFAHKNLIVHRDIKPSNILVTKEGQVKLLDFGVAKLLGNHECLDLTHTGELVLTPGFAAPEQLQGGNITVATDIYQLGLVLYELLTGTQVFQERSISFIELAKLICEHTPTKPSLLVGTIMDKDSSGPESISKLRNIDNKQLAKILSGDIDAIVLKALRNEADQRYQSVELFEADIQAYFNDNVVSARKHSFYYQAQKFVRRHIKSLFVVSLFVVLLSVYAINVTLQAKKIQEALDRSHLETEKSKRVTDFMLNIFRAADPSISGLEKVTAKELLDQGHIKILEELDNIPKIQGHMLLALGDIYYRQGFYQKSADVLEDGLERQRMALNRLDPILAETLNELAVAYNALGRFDEAEALFKESLSIYDDLIGRNSLDENIPYANANGDYAQLLSQKGEYSKAEKLFEKAVLILRRVTDGYHHELGSALNNLANLQNVSGNFELARKNMLEAIRIQEQAVGVKHSYFSTLLNNYSIMLLDVERYKEAETYSLHALEIQYEIFGKQHPEIADTLKVLGVLSHRQGNLKAADRYFSEALEINRLIQAEDNFPTARILLWRGAVLQDMGKFNEARSVYDQMMEIFRKSSQASRVIGRALCQLGSLAYVEGELTKAQDYYQEAIRLLPEKSTRMAIAQVGYAKVLLALDKLYEAKLQVRSALEIRKARLPESHGMIAEAQAVLGMILARLNDADTALPLLSMATENLKDRPYYHNGFYQKTLAALKKISD